MPTIGNRLPDDSFQPWEMKPGDYGKRGGKWWACCPGEQNGGGALFAEAPGDPSWTVVEHEEGLISVTPSIHLKLGEHTVYHGFLQNGVWTDNTGS